MLNDIQTNGQIDWYSNESYQRALAVNLVKTLGHKNAVNACYDHDWMETLNLVKRSRPTAVCL